MIEAYKSIVEYKKGADQDEELMSLLEERYKEVKEKCGSSKSHVGECEINLTKAKETRMMGTHKKPRKVHKLTRYVVSPFRDLQAGIVWWVGPSLYVTSSIELC